MDDEQLQLLLDNWNEIGPQARRVLLSLSNRLAKGAKVYGDFPQRPWKKETAEEALDMCIYLTADLLFD